MRQLIRERFESLEDLLRSKKRFLRSKVWSEHLIPADNVVLQMQHHIVPQRIEVHAAQASASGFHSSTRTRKNCRETLVQGNSSSRSPPLPGNGTP